MHLRSLLLTLFFLCASAFTLQAQSGFNGYWVTQTFTPVNTPGGVKHQKMLLCIQPICGSNELYRVYYYLWTKGFDQVVGPQFENGMLDASSGWLYMGGKRNNRDIIKLENGRMFYFLNNNPAGNAKTTILNLAHVDNKTGLQLEAIIKQKR